MKDKENAYRLAGIERDSSAEYFFEQYKEGKTDWFFCKDLYTNPQINFTGDLLGCCIPLSETFGANVFKDGLLNSLNNKKVLHAKMMLENSSINSEEDIPCKNCNIYKLLKENNFPFKFN